MSQYTPSNPVSGNWVKAVDLEQGSKAKLISEPEWVTSSFKDKNGNDKKQLVAKAKFQALGNSNEFNVSLNRATADGLYSAFGGDMRSWVDNILKVQTEKVIVGGKRVTSLYLLPDGYVLSEDSGGYAVIVPKDKAMAVKEPVAEPPFEDAQDEAMNAEVPF